MTEEIVIDHFTNKPHLLMFKVSNRDEPSPHDSYIRKELNKFCRLGMLFFHKNGFWVAQEVKI